ncbi:hypothetical protein J6590_021393 [Homalodisca vitripennis]|nr:hypothetical protein J6590_021393 [Homalodisca vitripennis]
MMISHLVNEGLVLMVNHWNWKLPVFPLGYRRVVIRALRHARYPTVRYNRFRFADLTLIKTELWLNSVSNIPEDEVLNRFLQLQHFALSKNADRCCRGLYCVAVIRAKPRRVGDCLVNISVPVCTEAGEVSTLQGRQSGPPFRHIPEFPVHSHSSPTAGSCPSTFRQVGHLSVLS